MARHGEYPKREREQGEREVRLQEAVSAGALAEYAQFGWRLLHIDNALGALAKRDVVVVSVRIGCLGREDGTRMAVLKGQVDGRDQVAFLTAGSVGELLRMLAGALDGSSLRWRDERPWKGASNP